MARGFFSAISRTSNPLKVFFSVPARGVSNDCSGRQRTVRLRKSAVGSVALVVVVTPTENLLKSVL